MSLSWPSKCCLGLATCYLQSPVENANVGPLFKICEFQESIKPIGTLLSVGPWVSTQVADSTKPALVLLGGAFKSWASMMSFFYLGAYLLDIQKGIKENKYWCTITMWRTTWRQIHLKYAVYRLFPSGNWSSDEAQDLVIAVQAHNFTIYP